METGGTPRYPKRSRGSSSAAGDTEEDLNAKRYLLSSLLSSMMVSSFSRLRQEEDAPPPSSPADLPRKRNDDTVESLPLLTAQNLKDNDVIHQQENEMKVKRYEILNSLLFPVMRFSSLG